MHTANAFSPAVAQARNAVAGIFTDHLLPTRPSRWLCIRSGEGIRVEGSPGFQVVNVSVGLDLVAIPLELASEVAAAIRRHAGEALDQLKTAKALLDLEPGEDA